MQIDAHLDFVDSRHGVTRGHGNPMRRGKWALIFCRSDKCALLLSIDIDVFCPSIAPGTGTPSHGGFLYYEVLELMQGLARSHQVVGIDLVEAAPDYDPTGSTAILAAQLLLNTLGFIFHARQT